MNVKIFKGPQYPVIEKKAHQLLYQIISAKMVRDKNENQQASRKENVSVDAKNSH